MSKTESQSQNRSIDRRTFIKGLGVAGAGAVGLSGRGRFGAVGDAQAIAPLIAAGAIGASVAVGWALREFEVVGSNPPAEGLTPEALKQQVYQTARTRKSTNASTIVDNRNILDGVENNAYTEAKIAAIEELNAGSAESAVLGAATAAIDSYQTTVEKNLLKTWNEAANELETITSTVESHTNVSQSDVLTPAAEDDPSTQNDLNFSTNAVTLADGTSFDVKRLALGAVGGNEWDPTYWNDLNPYEIRVYDSSGSVDFRYMKGSDWSPLWNSLQTKFQNVRNGMSTWVTNVYGQVQSGELKVSDLVTPRERAAIMANEEGGSQAVADLIALNIPVDLENEATITIPSTGTTLRGSFGLTDSTDGPIVTGETYDPETFTGDVYFTTDVSLLEGDWTAYQDGIDGGIVTVTQEPYEGTILSVETTTGETVRAPATEWTDTGSGTWTYDASGDLETPITQVASMGYFSESEATQYETLNLSSPFIVDSFENTESGEQTNQASFSNTEPQDDTNYITQEEWDDLEQKNQELIEKYEESQANAGGANVPGAQQIADLLGVSPGVGAAIAVGTGIAAVLVITQR